jgi:hypothetical protein
VRGRLGVVGEAGKVGVAARSGDDPFPVADAEASALEDMNTAGPSAGALPRRARPGRDRCAPPVDSRRRITKGAHIRSNLAHYAKDLLGGTIVGRCRTRLSPSPNPTAARPYLRQSWTWFRALVASSTHAGSDGVYVPGVNTEAYTNREWFLLRLETARSPNGTHARDRPEPQTGSLATQLKPGVVALRKNRVGGCVTRTVGGCPTRREESCRWHGSSSVALVWW